MKACALRDFLFECSHLFCDKIFHISWKGGGGACGTAWATAALSSMLTWELEPAVYKGDSHNQIQSHIQSHGFVLSTRGFALEGYSVEYSTSAFLPDNASLALQDVIQYCGGPHPSLLVDFHDICSAFKRPVLWGYVMGMTYSVWSKRRIPIKH